MFFDISGAKKKDNIKDYYDIVIIGGGPAGISAAIYSVQGGIKPLVIEKTLAGGQMNLTEVVENYPGFSSISGSDISEKFHDHAKAYGVDFLYSGVEKISFENDLKIIKTDDNKTVKSKVLIIATGANPRKLGVKGENEFSSKGVSYCATCDGHFFRDQKVAVIGGGNTAVEEALYLSKIAKEVVIIHRRDQLRADKIYQDKAFSTDNISFIWNSAVEEIKGDKKVKSLIIKNVNDNTLSEVNFDGVFVFVGNSPVTDFLGDAVEKNKNGYIITNKYMETSHETVYAVGDVAEKELRQIVTAVSDGAVASSNAIRKYFN
ncbi:MAG: thioredoxin-disulfide reductase [Thermotogae bacterium]|nr:thioredoxin-disulfide reductase [Thermotogota bacterium]HOO75383.1 thioredoxin-disulfide reductase [Tepiditoga sp.]